MYIGQLQAKLDAKIKENRSLNEKISRLETDQAKQEELIRGLMSEKIDTENLPRVSDAEVKEKLAQLVVENSRLKASFFVAVSHLLEYTRRWCLGFST